MPVHLLMHVLAFFHVENIARDQQAVEVEEEAEVEYQEEQPQEFEVAEQVEEQALESNLLTPTRSKASTGSF